MWPSKISSAKGYFYPRPPRGERPLFLLCPVSGVIFLSTPSARRATCCSDCLCPVVLQISIHALREESDDGLGAADRSRPLFLSTPSARRATPDLQKAGSCPKNFYPRPPRGERRENVPGAFSSHKDFYPRPPRGERLPSIIKTRSPTKFLSTPSARRATQKAWYTPKEQTLFLSTPSARRATAKTERKHPAFVSLYTSLHKLQRDVCKPNRKITSLLAQTAGIPVRSVPGNHVCCRFALARHQKISTLSWANSGCSPMCSTLVW